MKKLIVVLLAMVMVFAFAATASAVTWNDNEIPDYSDVATLTDAQQVAIYRLTALGVLDGMNGWGGAYSGASYFTREQLAKIAVYLTGNEDAVDLYASFGSAFSDVSDGRWSEGYINLCYELGLMKGVSTSAKVFAPTSTVTYQEFATVVLRALGYDDNLPGSWPTDYSNKAVKMGLTKHSDYVGPKSISRADMAVLANNALEECMVTYVGNNSLSGVIAAINKDEVDADGYTYSTWYTNEDLGSSHADTMLSAIFDCYPVYAEVVFDSLTAAEMKGLEVLREAAGWSLKNGDLFFQFAYGEIEGDQENDLAAKFDVATNYYIYGGDLTNLAGQQADVLMYWNDDEDQYEVLFVEITSSVAYDDSYKAKDYDLVEEADLLELFGIKPDASDVEGAVDVYTNDDDEVYAVYPFQAFMKKAFNIVDEVKTEKINGKLSTSDGYEDNFKYYDEDDEFENVLFYDMEAKKFVSGSDLNEGDVYYHAGNVGEEKVDGTKYAIDLVLIYPAQSGEIDKVSSHYAYLDGEKRSILGDVDETYTVYSAEGLDGTFNEYDYKEVGDFDGAVTFANAYVPEHFTYVCDSTYSTVKGVIVDISYTAKDSSSNKISTITLFEADGEEHEYSVTGDFRTDVNSYSDDGNNWTGSDNTGSSESGLEEGDYIKASLDGEKLDDLKAVYGEWSAYCPDNWRLAVKDADEGDYLLKVTNTNAGTSTLYEIADDCVIYLLTSEDSEGNDLDEYEIMDVKELMEEDGDYFVSNFYANDTDCDTLYLVDLVDGYDGQYMKAALKTLNGEDAVTSKDGKYYVWTYDAETQDNVKTQFTQESAVNVVTAGRPGVLLYKLNTGRIATLSKVIDEGFLTSWLDNAVSGDSSLENNLTTSKSSAVGSTEVGTKVSQNATLKKLYEEITVDGDDWQIAVGSIEDKYNKVLSLNIFTAKKTYTVTQVSAVVWDGGVVTPVVSNEVVEFGKASSALVADVSGKGDAEVIDYSDLEEGDWVIVVANDKDAEYILLLEDVDDFDSFEDAWIDWIERNQA